MLLALRRDCMCDPRALQQVQLYHTARVAKTKLIPMQAYGSQQPGYPPQHSPPPQHQMPYASQPMYPQQAPPAYPTYPPAAPSATYYAAPAYPQPQMHMNPMPAVQQPTNNAAQAAMMAAIKVWIPRL